MSIPSSPHAVLIAGAPQNARHITLRKRMAYVSGGDDYIFCEDEHDFSGGEWRKPAEVQPGTKVWGGDTSTIPGTFSMVVAEAEEDTLASRYAIRHALAQHDANSLILGMPHADHFQATALGFLTDPAGEIIGTLTRLNDSARNNKVLCDAPRSWFTVDLDGLQVDHDVLANDYALPQIIYDAFDDANLDWLIADCIVHLSSRHGLGSVEHVRAHVDWQLEQPLSLSQQKVVAYHINQAFLAAGYGEPLDLQIYDAARLLFTAPPFAFRRQVQNGKIAVVPHPLPRLQRVHMSAIHEQYARIPPEFLRAPPHMTADVLQTRARMLPVRQRSWANPNFAPGNTHNPTRNRIHRTVMQTPYRHHERAKRETLAELVRLTAAVPGTEVKRNARLETLYKNYDALWNGSLARRYGTVTQAPYDPKRGAIPLEEARRALPGYFAERLREAAQYVSDRTYSTSFLPPRPKYTLVKAPPGLGKTHSLVRSIDGSLLLSHRFDIRTPTVTVSKEIYEAFRERWKDNPYALQAIRLELGREHHCQPDMMDKCRRVEAYGLSARSTVCTTCPHSATCPWPTQQPSTAPGVTIGQHAHLMSTISHIKREDSEYIADCYIIDETPMSTFVGEPLSLSLEGLERRTKRTSLYTYGKAKRIDRDATTDLVTYRGRLLEILRANMPGDLATKAVTHTLPWIEDALDLEDRAVTQYWGMMQSLAQQDGWDGGEMRRLAELRAAAELMHTVCRAIQASAVKAERARSTVFGVWCGKKNVYAHIRKEPPLALTCRHVIQLDATANTDIERAIWSNHMDMSEITLNATAAHYTLTQYIDRAYSDAMFCTNAKGKYFINGRRMAQYIKRKAFAHEKVLVVATKAVIKLITGRYTFPEHVSFLNYGDTKGRNDFEDADCLVLIGRKQPPLEAMQRKASALYYNDTRVFCLNQYADALPVRTEQRRLRGGQQIAVNMPYYPDPNVNAVLEQEAWAECLQALGRVRAIQRTADNPVDITVFGPWDTGLEIDHVRDWAEEKREAHEIFEEAGISPEFNSVIARRMYCGYFEHYGKNGIQNLTRNYQRRDADWPKWRVDMGNGAETVRVHRRHAQTPAAVSALIKQHCGLEPLRQPRPLR